MLGGSVCGDSSGRGCWWTPSGFGRRLMFRRSRSTESWVSVGDDGRSTLLELILARALRVTLLVIDSQFGGVREA